MVVKRSDVFSRVWELEKVEGGPRHEKRAKQAHFFMFFVFLKEWLWVKKTLVK